MCNSSVHFVQCSVKYTVTSPGLVVTRNLPVVADFWSDGHLRRTHGPITAIEIKLDVASSGGSVSAVVIFQMRTR